MSLVSKKAADLHKSVMLKESLELLQVKDGTYIDATLGLAGHSEAILNESDKVKLIGVDQDLDAIEQAKARLKHFEERVTIVNANFSDIKKIALDMEAKEVSGVLADLGVSSIQFDSKSRGFSFRFDAPLDMRMDKNSDSETAAELLERLSEEEIANLIYEFGEERFSRRIARRIVSKRENGNSIKTTFELADVVKKSVRRNKKSKIHPATKTFQALRIAVNNEIEILEDFVKDSINLLEKDGRLVVITFHSLEDRIIKRTMQKLSGKCFCPPKFPKCVCGSTKEVKIITRKPLTPNDEEITMNPRSRSAKLRACYKLN